jgi:hypothetical protein
MIGARIQLIIIRVLLEKHRPILPGFAEKLTALRKKEDDKIATYILENKTLLEFLSVS